MKYRSYKLFFLLALVGCRPSKTPEMPPDTLPITAGQHSADNGSRLQFQREKAAGAKDTLSFRLNEPTLVTIRIITPGDTGNIRLAQIVSPDGETDGPFGKAYTDSLQIPGVYRIIVAENLMQESLYQGTYTVRVDMQKSRTD